MMYGDLPKKARKLVEEFISNNTDDLLEIWETNKFKKLPPLE